MLSPSDSLWMTIKELGSSDTVLDLLAEYFSKKQSDIKARYEDLTRENITGDSKSWNTDGTIALYLEKDLDDALDSFDNLFCRRCYVFDCKLHGCSQDLIFPVEKPLQGRLPDAVKEPCGHNCYRLASKPESRVTSNSSRRANYEAKHGITTTELPGKPTLQLSKASQSERTSSNSNNVSESSNSENLHMNDISVLDPLSSPTTIISGEVGNMKRNSKRITEHAPIAKRKRQKKTGISDLNSISGIPKDNNALPNLQNENQDIDNSKKVKTQSGRRLRSNGSPAEDCDSSFHVEDLRCQLNEIINEHPPVNSSNSLNKGESVNDKSKQEVTDDRTWKQFERVLYDKGLEIFGRNSCLISRNLMNGLKTCREVYQYMNHSENQLSLHGGDGPHAEGCSKGDGGSMGKQVRRRSKFLRRKGKARRLKYSWKSAGFNYMKKRISGKDQPCRHYNPCGCKTACGKDCPCIVNEACCEKYCGCPKSCKNRFRGCHCAKSQCRSRQCPCFAANRECDPDVCRNCWIGCGDGTLGLPSQGGDNYECRNMKLLLKQQQKVLLGRSDVSGWGAFLKNTVGKHEYLGEYTGELISHREADKRGKIYDRENSSFLFNLNDQFVLDAYRRGDKLKFANHSPDPNCYAKVMMVAGDHRVGIFAKEKISAGEELFYDYQYDPDRAPEWAKKPESSATKRDEGAPSSGRARKHTS